jgi:hypothetical protein
MTRGAENSPATSPFAILTVLIIMLQACNEYLKLKIPKGCSSVERSEENFSHFVSLGGRRKLQLRFKAWDPSLEKMRQGVKILLSTVPHLEGNRGVLIHIRPQILGGGIVLSKYPVERGKGLSNKI